MSGTWSADADSLSLFDWLVRQFNCMMYSKKHPDWQIISHVTGRVFSVEESLEVREWSGWNVYTRVKVRAAEIKQLLVVEEELKAFTYKQAVTQYPHFRKQYQQYPK